MSEHNDELLEDLETDNAADIKGGVSVTHNGRTIASADANLSDGVTAQAGDTNANVQAGGSGVSATAGDNSAAVGLD